MSAEKDTRTQAQIDSNELGSVDSLQDLEASHEGSNARIKQEQTRLDRPAATGYFEGQAFELANAEAAPLALDSKTVIGAPAYVAEYEAGYNMYASPLRSSIRGMGRVKDLSEAGAPMTPTELKANPALAKRFKQLSLHDGSDGVSAGAQTAFNTWQQSQTHFQLDVASFTAGQMELKAAQDNWHVVRDMIEQRKLEATRGNAKGELDEINEAADTCAEIVKFSAEAWSCAGEIGEAMEASQALDGSAAKEMAAKGDIEVEATGPYASADKANDVSTKVQNLTKAGTTAGDAAGDTNHIYQRVKGIASKASKTDLNLSLEDVFVVVMGNGGKKLELENKIKKLSEQIENLKWNEVSRKIDEGASRLSAFKMEVKTRQASVNAERVMARSGAEAFNLNLKGASGDNGALGEMAMYMAEAQQERALFARTADKDYRSFVAKNWAATDDYASLTSTRGHLEHIGEGEDLVKLRRNVATVKEARDYSSSHLPGWEKQAHAWRSFLEAETQKPLIAENVGPQDKEKQ